MGVFMRMAGGIERIARKAPERVGVRAESPVRGGMLLRAIITAGLSFLALIGCGREEIQKGGKDSLARACGFDKFDDLNQTQKLIFNGAKENNFLGLCDALKTGMLTVATPDGGTEIIETALGREDGGGGSSASKKYFHLDRSLHSFDKPKNRRRRSEI